MGWAFLSMLAVALAPGLGADLGIDADAADGSLVDAELRTPAVDVAVDVPQLPSSAPLLPDLSLGEGSAQDGAAASNGPAASEEGTFEALVPDTPAGRTTAGVSLAAALTAVGWAVLRAFGLAPLLPFFSRIEDGDLAKHPARRAALDYINANPGASVRQVQQALGLAWGTTVHHLRRLERAGLVAVRHDGGQRGHWPLGQAPPRDGLSAADRAMAALVKTSPGLPQKDLARLSGVQPPAACKRLARLEAEGLVAQVQDGRNRLYVPTGRLQALEISVPTPPVRAVPMPMATMGNPIPVAA